MNTEQNKSIEQGGFRPDEPAGAPRFVPEQDFMVEKLMREPPKPKPPKQTDSGRRRKKSVWTRLGRLVVVLAILFGLYLTAVFSSIPFIAKWRTIYIQTAMATMRHQWLATYFIPGFVIDEAMNELEQSRQMQIGVNSTWDISNAGYNDGRIVTRNATLTNTEGMSEDQIMFYNDFWEIDVDTMESYVRQNPDVVRDGWDSININEAGLEENGTTIRTQMGEKVLAINARERILIVRQQGSGYRGLMAICKDPTRISMHYASTLGIVGQRCGEIAAAHNGIIGMTASGFLDDGGVGSGAEPVGFSMCNGEPYGYHMPSGYKRLELHEDNLMYVRDSQDPVDPTTTDCVEFSPAMIVDGISVLEGNGWGWSDLQPRACVGQSEYGEILMLLIEGRRPGISIGLSVGECADLMLKHKCMQALNVDGGTTAMIWYDGEYIMESSNPVMTKGRQLPNAWVYERVG